MNIDNDNVFLEIQISSETSLLLKRIDALSERVVELEKKYEDLKNITNNSIVFNKLIDEGKKIQNDNNNG